MRRRDVVALAVVAGGVARMARFARHRAPRVLGPWDADVVAIVPARDEAATVAACVNALRANGVRDVVVVDDGSSDGTAPARGGDGRAGAAFAVCREAGRVPGRRCRDVLGVAVVRGRRRRRGS